MVFAGSTTGLDYRFSNGISLFFPWSFLALKMTFENYVGDVQGEEFSNGLSFLRTDNGLLWFLFIFVVVAYTIKEGNEMLFLAKMKTWSEKFKENKSFSQKINLLLATIKIILSGETGHRDDEPRSRGLSAFASYFGEIKNLGLNLDLERDFETHCTEKANQ
jgi:hypothetical protein